MRWRGNRSSVRGPSQEFRLVDPETGEPVILVREQVMSGPPLWILAVIFMFATAWYTFWYGLGTWTLMRWVGWELVAAAVPVALLATIRIAARLREKQAVENGWPSPVMRQRQEVLLLLVLLSVALGGWSGWLLNQIPAVAGVGFDDVIVMGVAAIWSVIGMLRKIPKQPATKVEQ